jgi:hypothetical protein
MSSDDFDDLSDELRKSIETWEEAEPQSLFALLPQSGVSLPPPAELDDAQLTKKLWEVIHALALLGTFLHNTDHLSDRELYTELWTDGLREPAVLMPDNPAYAYHFDMVGSGSEEHMRLYMKYYASEEDRRNWLRDWPEDVLPDHEDPPHDRDRRLPRAEGRTDSPVM